MAHDLIESNETVNAGADAKLALLNNGYLRIYDGTRPTDANTAVVAQNLLVELRWNATAFAASSAGVAAANAISNALIAISGIATWFRALKSDGTTPVFDGEIGTSGSDLNLANVVLVADGSYQAITGFTYTEPK